MSKSIISTADNSNAAMQVIIAINISLYLPQILMLKLPMPKVPEGCRTQSLVRRWPLQMYLLARSFHDIPLVAIAVSCPLVLLSLAFASPWADVWRYVAEFTINRCIALMLHFSSTNRSASQSSSS